jgi:Heavy metal associated domain 2
MIDNIHDLPGRLRIRMEVLRRNPQAIAEIRQSLGDVRGVLEIESNPRTGSLLVHYRVGATSAAALLDGVAACGYVPPRAHGQPIALLTEIALSFALNKVIDHGTTALLAAII